MHGGAGGGPITTFGGAGGGPITMYGGAESRLNYNVRTWGGGLHYNVDRQWSVQGMNYALCGVYLT